MAPEPRNPYQLGGAAFIGGGLLFLLRALLDFSAGAPPSTGLDILGWIASHALAQKLESEILFFAAVCLVPGVIALYRALASVDGLKAAIGCGLVAVVIPVLAFSLVVHGRLVYPVYGIRADTPALAAFALATFYGGMHAVYLLMAVATVVLSLAMTGGGFGKALASLGMVTAAADIAAAYPDIIGSTLMLVTQLFFAGWFVATGARLVRMGAHPAAA